MCQCKVENYPKLDSMSIYLFLSKDVLNDKCQFKTTENIYTTIVNTPLTARVD